jgi:hypothetical protein
MLLGIAIKNSTLSITLGLTTLSKAKNEVFSINVDRHNNENVTPSITLC